MSLLDLVDGVHEDYEEWANLHALIQMVLEDCHSSDDETFELSAEDMKEIEIEDQQMELERQQEWDNEMDSKDEQEEILVTEEEATLIWWLALSDEDEIGCSGMETYDEQIEEEECWNENNFLIEPTTAKLLMHHMKKLEELATQLRSGGNPTHMPSLNRYVDDISKRIEMMKEAAVEIRKKEKQKQREKPTNE